MPVPVSYPGVYIQEVPSGVRAITGVSTSIALFMGRTKRGRLNVPTRVLSFAAYERNFGTDTVISEMTDSGAPILPQWGPAGLHHAHRRGRDGKGGRGHAKEPSGH
jgi:hypothetical protein